MPFPVVPGRNVPAASQAPALESIPYILSDGDLCDGGRSIGPWRGCPQLAYARVHIHAEGGEPYFGALHFCLHHFAVYADKVLAMQLADQASIVDERDRFYLEMM